MKKNKLKIIISCVCFLLVVSVMTVGIWAATQTTIGVNISVGFEATGIKGYVKGYIVGDYLYDTSSNPVVQPTMGGVALFRDETSMLYSSSKLAEWTLETQNKQGSSSSLNFVFCDPDEDGMINNGQGVTLYLYVYNNGEVDFTVSVTPTTLIQDSGENVSLSVSGGGIVRNDGQPVIITALFMPLKNSSFTINDDNFAIKLNLDRINESNS